jgi:hypothetical protein
LGPAFAAELPDFGGDFIRVFLVLEKQATSAPAFAKAMAMALPMPRPAPVTRATWFSRVAMGVDGRSERSAREENHEEVLVDAEGEFG